MSKVSAIDLALQEAFKAKAAIDNAIRAIAPTPVPTTTPTPALVTCPRDVFILWEYEPDGSSYIAGIYSTKIGAEHDMRVLIEGEKLSQAPCRYMIQSHTLSNERV